MANIISVLFATNVIFPFTSIVYSGFDINTSTDVTTSLHAAYSEFTVVEYKSLNRAIFADILLTTVVCVSPDPLMARLYVRCMGSYLFVPLTDGLIRIGGECFMSVPSYSLNAYRTKKGNVIYPSSSFFAILLTSDAMNFVFASSRACFFISSVAEFDIYTFMAELSSLLSFNP